MLIKTRDDNKEALIELNRLLALPYITKEQEFLLEREIHAVTTGCYGEKNSAYYLNFYYGDNSKNWAVIHDLRIEFEGRVAQIDHLLISRFLEVYVLESKNFYNGVQINEHGEFSAFYEKRTYGIPSPIEQNARHISVLKSLLKKEAILPRRLGLNIAPKFINYILISPDSVIKRPPKKSFNTGNVIKADTLKKLLDEELNRFPTISELVDVAKMISPKALKEFANKLACYHRPLAIDWQKKFSIKPSATLTSNRANISKNSEVLQSSPNYYCAKCKVNITAKVAHFCWNDKVKFGGRAYCFNCQKTIKS